MSERPTLSLSADQVRADGEAFLITMPGDVDVCESCNGSDIGRDGDVSSSCSSCNGGGIEVPPSVLVALNQPCPSCEGRGHVGQDRSHMCPDCGGSGRLVFDLKTPCNHLVMRQASNSQPICIRCMDDGTVSHRVWLDPEWGIRQIDEGYEARLVIGGSHE